MLRLFVLVLLWGAASAEGKGCKDSAPGLQNLKIKDCPGCFFVFYAPELDLTEDSCTHKAEAIFEEMKAAEVAGEMNLGKKNETVCFWKSLENPFFICICYKAPCHRATSSERAIKVETLSEVNLATGTVCMAKAGDVVVYKFCSGTNSCRKMKEDAERDLPTEDEACHPEPCEQEDCCRNDVYSVHRDPCNAPASKTTAQEDTEPTTAADPTTTATDPTTTATDPTTTATDPTTTVTSTPVSTSASTTSTTNSTSTTVSTSEGASASEKASTSPAGSKSGTTTTGAAGTTTTGAAGTTTGAAGTTTGKGEAGKGWWSSMSGAEQGRVYGTLVAVLCALGTIATLSTSAYFTYIYYRDFGV